MPSRTVKVASRVGLHARPASLFVQAVTATGLPVTIAKTGGDPVDARSILMVMGLGVGLAVRGTGSPAPGWIRSGGNALDRVFGLCDFLGLPRVQAHQQDDQGGRDNGADGNRQ